MLGYKNKMLGYKNKVLGYTNWSVGYTIEISDYMIKISGYMMEMLSCIMVPNLLHCLSSCLVLKVISFFGLLHYLICCVGFSFLLYFSFIMFCNAKCKRFTLTFYRWSAIYYLRILFIPFMFTLIISTIVFILTIMGVPLMKNITCINRILYCQVFKVCLLWFTYCEINNVTSLYLTFHLVMFGRLILGITRYC